jgi:DNA polymerase-3 subunit delta'
VNQDMTEQVLQLARVLSPERLLGCMDAIGTARERIDANVQPLLALEAMAISLQLPR